NYLDRQTLSVVAPLLETQLSLSTLAYSHVVFLFLLGYTLGQTLDGKFIDRVGTRVGMLCCVSLWSAVSMLHSLVTDVAGLGSLRFLLGIAEAGNWPGGVKAAAENFTPKRRALAIGVFNSGSTAGAMIAPPLVAAVAGAWGWRPMFAVIGVSGFVWVLFWKKFYRKEPGRVQTPRAAALQAPRTTRACLGDRAVRGLMISRFFSDPIWWFYAFWLPEYLAQSRGFSLARIGRTAWIPFVFAGLGGWLGGMASDALVRRGVAPALARKRVMAVCALLMLCGVPAFVVRSSTAALAFISVVLFAYTGWASNILSLVADLFRSSEAAHITGLSGTTAAIGGMLFTLATGWLVQNVSYGSVFLASSVMILSSLAVILWMVPSRPKTPGEEWQGLLSGAGRE
ncbi:MAG TPA: MFS transporter, partial [Terriglobia bacterium]|nr:MFS transporter [Terriglobia bacterium]